MSGAGRRVSFVILLLLLTLLRGGTSRRNTPLLLRYQASLTTEEPQTNAVFHVETLREAEALARGFCEMYAQFGTNHDRTICRQGLLSRAQSHFMDIPAAPPPDATSLAGIRVVVCLYGVLPRSLRHVWPAQREQLVRVLEQHGAKVDLFGFDLDVEGALVDGQRLDRSEIANVPFNRLERHLQAALDEELERLCAGSSCDFSQYEFSSLASPVMGQGRGLREAAGVEVPRMLNANTLRQSKAMDGRNALRQMYSESRVATFLLSSSRAQAKAEVEAEAEAGVAVSSSLSMAPHNGGEEAADPIKSKASSIIAGRRRGACCMMSS